jgi:hypothetical protein
VYWLDALFSALEFHPSEALHDSTFFAKVVLMVDLSLGLRPWHCAGAIRYPLCLEAHSHLVWLKFCDNQGKWCCGSITQKHLHQPTTPPIAIEPSCQYSGGDFLSETLRERRCSEIQRAPGAAHDFRTSPCSQALLLGHRSNHAAVKVQQAAASEHNKILVSVVGN